MEKADSTEAREAFIFLFIVPKTAENSDRVIGLRMKMNLKWKVCQLCGIIEPFQDFCTDWNCLDD